MPDTKPKLDNLTLMNVRLLFRNFAGRAQQFNEEGNRNFCIILEPELAERMKADGWNVKPLKVRDEGDVPEQYIQVKVNFNSERPPKVVLITNGQRLALGPDEVAIMDFIELSNVDVTLNPYAWDMSGKTGITAYLKTCYATQAMDELDERYGNSQVPSVTQPDGQDAMIFGTEEPDFEVADNIDTAHGEAD